MSHLWSDVPPQHHGRHRLQPEQRNFRQRERRLLGYCASGPVCLVIQGHLKAPPIQPSSFVARLVVTRSAPAQNWASRLPILPFAIIFFATL